MVVRIVMSWKSWTTHEIRYVHNTRAAGAWMLVLLWLLLLVFLDIILAWFIWRKRQDWGMLQPSNCILKLITAFIVRDSISCSCGCRNNLRSCWNLQLSRCTTFIAWMLSWKRLNTRILLDSVIKIRILNFSGIVWVDRRMVMILWKLILLGI